MNTPIRLSFSLLFVGILLLLSSNTCETGNQPSKLANSESSSQDTVAKIDSSQLLFEYNLQDYTLDVGTIESGESLGKLLHARAIPSKTVHQVSQSCASLFDVRLMKVGREYMFLSDPEDTIPHTMVYKANSIDYYFFHFGDTIFTEKKSKPVDIKLALASGVIESSLSETMEKQGLSQRLVLALADDIYPWTINFFNVQPGDKFKVYYEEKFVDGEFIGIGKVFASVFEYHSKPFYAFRYEKENIGDFYNEKGDNLRNFFLKAPVQYTRISSRYQRARRHPVTGRVKAHKGTDFAAPKNTPIVATANGIVTHAQYKRWNGNYVKIKHNNTYTTQYLHMNKIAKGMRPGVAVQQGEVIGYVGKTGLATGYHVCYRFWKHGKQVDPFKCDLPASEPLAESLIPDYLATMEPVKAALDELAYDTDKKYYLKQPIGAKDTTKQPLSNTPADTLDL